MRYTSFRTLFGTLGTEKLHILADLVAPKLCVVEHAHARKSQRTWVLGRTWGPVSPFGSYQTEMWLCRSYRPGIGVCLVGFVDALVECSMQEKFLSWQVLPLRSKPQNIFNMFCSSRRRVQHLIRLMSLDPSKEWVCTLRSRLLVRASIRSSPIMSKHTLLIVDWLYLIVYFRVHILYMHVHIHVHACP